MTLTSAISTIRSRMRHKRALKEEMRGEKEF